MSRTESRGVWDTLLIVAVAALAVTFAHAQQAAAEDAVEEGRIVDLSSGRSADAPVDEQPAAEGPSYWLGIQGAPIDSPVLRTHLQLADDVGVVIADIVPGSPAEKAGLRKHDVLLEVNGERITDMTVLQFAVASSDGKPVELKLIRLAKEMTIAVTPEERPADLALAQPQQATPGDMPMNELQDMLRQLEGNLAGGVRIFGPGMIGSSQRMDLRGLPQGVSVQITREGDGPATITVRRGEESWTVKGDDEESLKQLPDDVRPFVEKMLSAQGAGAGFDFEQQLQELLPDRLGQFEFRGGDARKAARARAGAAIDRAGDVNQRMLQRLEELQRQIDQLHRMLEENPLEEGNPEPESANG